MTLPTGQHSAAPSMPDFDSPYFAAIDLGSNSFHMLVVRLNGDKIDIIDREKEMVQIARGMQANGTLDSDAEQRALECLTRFSERIRTIPNAQVRAVGTKALRTARNANKFLRKAEEALGTSVQIISGYEEARLVYTGLSNTVTNDDHQRLVIDIGGGSTEFVIGKSYDAIMLESLPLGCVTYSESFRLRNDTLTAANMKRAYLAACNELEAIRKNYLRKGWDIAYGTSGTMRAIAELVAERDGGAVITKESLDAMIQQVIRDGGVNNDAITKLRQDVLPGGLAVLQAIFDQLKLSTIHVANATLKEGLVYDTIGRFSDHDSRVATISQLKQRYEIDDDQAQRVSRTALLLWQQLEAPDLPGVSRTKILRWAAELHEIGLSISHTGFHHHGYYILRHSDLAGFGRYEQYILANLVRSHRKKLSLARFDELDKHAVAAFVPLLLCLRLSVKLHRHREDVDEHPLLSIKDKNVVLTFNQDWLNAHPLTQSGLEQEISSLKNIGLELKIEGAQ